MSVLYRWMFDLSYRFSKPVWDREALPPQVIALTERYPTGGRAIDLGCGTGSNSIYLAQHGFEVLGIDFSKKAIQLAHQKTKQAKVIVDFRVQDVTRLDSLTGSFDVVLDVGCFHNLAPIQRVRYAENVSRLTHTGSTFLLWALDPSSHAGIGLRPEDGVAYFDPPFSLDRTETDSFNRRASLWYWFIR